MTSHISIEWLHGRPANGSDDEARAIEAASRVLDTASVDYIAAFDEYKKQWAEFDDEAPMTGLAALWIDANKAADVALTNGWHNPDGAACSIVAWSTK